MDVNKVKGTKRISEFENPIAEFFLHIDTHPQLPLNYIQRQIYNLWLALTLFHPFLSARKRRGKG
jgi:hypothetical protein